MIGEALRQRDVGPAVLVVRPPQRHVAQEHAFGPFVLDCASRQLLRDRRPVKIRPQVYELLRILATQRPHSVSIEQLAGAWTGKAVRRHTIGVTLAELRAILGDYGSWIRRDGRAGFSLRTPASDSLIRKGDHCLGLSSRAGVGLALESFSKAVALAPEDHRAFEGRLRGYLWLAAFGLKPGWQLAPQSRTATERLLSLVGATPTLRCQSAFGALVYQRRLEDARATFEQLTVAEPPMITAYVGKASVLVALGDLDGARAAAERAVASDPLSADAAVSELAVTIWRGDTKLAVRRGERTVELHPFHGPARIYHGMALELQGELAPALEQYRAATRLIGQLPWSQSLEAGCLVKMGRVGDARRIRNELNARRRGEYIDPYAMARIHLALGSMDSAADALAQAVNDRVGYLPTVAVDPFVAPFRNDRRFAAIVGQLRQPC
jgi:DNA-binding winged helix-turn-helix (wHTH) protein